MNDGWWYGDRWSGWWWSLMIVLWLSLMIAHNWSRWLITIDDVLTLTHRQQIWCRGHRTGSNSSEVEEYLEKKWQWCNTTAVHIITAAHYRNPSNMMDWSWLVANDERDWSWSICIWSIMVDHERSWWMMLCIGRVNSWILVMGKCDGCLSPFALFWLRLRRETRSTDTCGTKCLSSRWET